VFPARPPILDMVCEKTPEQRAEIRRYWHEANRESSPRMLQDQS
jgi:hypothetical protein